MVDSMRLILVRHGAAHAGLHGIIAGPLGCAGLTDIGRDQAARLRDHVRKTGQPEVDVLLASELPRAIETAQIVAPGLGIDDVPQDCELCEVHTGVADGTDWADYPTRFGAFDMEAEPDRAFAPGGDSWNAFHERVDRMMQRLAAEHVGKTVMAVCHAGVIAATLRVRFGQRHPANLRLQPTNTGLTEWEFDAGAGQWILRGYDDASHLAGTGLA